MEWNKCIYTLLSNPFRPHPCFPLKDATGHDVLIELKIGETHTGTVISCDSWMNVRL